MTRMNNTRKDKEDNAQVLLSTAIVTDMALACLCVALYSITPWLQKHISFLADNVWEFIRDLSIAGIVSAITATIGLSTIYVVYHLCRRFRQRKR